MLCFHFTYNVVSTILMAQRTVSPKSSPSIQFVWCYYWVAQTSIPLVLPGWCWHMPMTKTGIQSSHLAVPEARNSSLGCFFFHGTCLRKLIIRRTIIRRSLRVTWGSCSQICGTLKLHQTEITEGCPNLALREQLLICVCRGLCHSVPRTWVIKKAVMGRWRHSHGVQCPGESSKAQMNPESCLYFRQKS